MTRAASASVVPHRTITESAAWWWVRLGRWLPPVRNPRFWATQVLVIFIAVVHDAIELFGFLPWFGQAYLIPVSMFFIPVVYSALYFGLSGAAATALWCTVITIPNWVFVHDGSEAVGSMSQMVIINAVAIFVGNRVDQQMRARADAEAAGQALRASESKYRSLFETSGEGVLIVDQAGQILECNAAAASLLQTQPRQLRNRELKSVLSTAETKKRSRTQSGRGDIVLADSRGTDVWIEPVSTPLPEPEGGSQVVLRNVTEQKRRQLGLETYAAEVVRAQEEERKRVAQELHDDTVQSLVLLWRKLDQLGAASNDDRPEHSGSLRAARDLAGSIAESVRGYAQGLRPPVLDDLGLAPAIRRLAKEFTGRSETPAEVVVRGDARRLAPENELALFRIAQESLRNAERHAHASSVLVSLDYRPATTVLTVRDNGRGFHRKGNDGLSDPAKLGVLGMQERARMCGGKVTIRSRPGAGTTIVARIPSRLTSA